jgi:hypothetical protein
MMTAATLKASLPELEEILERSIRKAILKDLHQDDEDEGAPAAGLQPV